MKVLVPVRYPLTQANVKAIKRGHELSRSASDGELLIFHLNELHEDRTVGRRELREAVEAAVGDVGANYLIRNGFFVEEAFLQAAVEHDIDRIVVSPERRSRWKRLLASALDTSVDPVDAVRSGMGIEIETVELDPPDG